MLKRTALFNEHLQLGGRLIDFGGWELPVQYSGVLDEHRACRAAAGLFDVSHMGEVHVEGPLAERFLSYLITNDIAKATDGQAQYTVMCNDHGGIVDDLVIYRRATDRFLVVVNASNTEKDFAHMQSIAKRFITAQGAAQGAQAANPSALTLSNRSAEYSQIALQGPCAARILSSCLGGMDLSGLKTYRFFEAAFFGGIPTVVARTGYTGEDGFELYVPWDRAPSVWRALLAAGTPLGLKPCGLGARDTLRLEMKYPLYGNELTDETHPLEAGLGWVVKLDKGGDFVGRDALLSARERGLSRKLVGFKLLERGIARHGYEAYDQEGRERIGVVTSGSQSPSLNIPIGIAYLPASLAAHGSRFTVNIRDAKVSAEVIPTPFYKRPY